MNFWEDTMPPTAPSFVTLLQMSFLSSVKFSYMCGQNDHFIMQISDEIVIHVSRDSHL